MNKLKLRLPNVQNRTNLWQCCYRNSQIKDLYFGIHNAQFYIDAFLARTEINAFLATIEMIIIVLFRDQQVGRKIFFSCQ